ncbi:MAG TPA: dienelactone hydrolase family protein [Vicinamibacterales bacterium]|nr:dienelactone hydrolase family protein [Vicinamibacterales bacterium]
MRLIPIAILLAASAVVLTAQRPASVDPYDEMAARLKAGPTYQSARAGRITLPTSDRGVSLDNVLEVPADYDPARRWPLRVSLHGGVGRAAPGPGDPPARPLTNRIQSAGELVLHPRAWSGSEWWTWGQVDNITKLIDRVKREYNVDESRTYITGISDGGTGVYFFAMRAATPWAACLPLNGQPLVLANPDSGAEGQFFASNLANCPLHVVNGGKDPLYPAASVSPLIAMFRRGGIAVDFQVYPEAGHDVSWWPDERAKFEAFLAAHRRVAHPERISWATERTDRYNRFRWLVIDRLGQRSSDRPLPDVNKFSVDNSRELALFSRSRQSGRVDITRTGNTFEAETRGVSAFTLLLSPDVVDFSSPVRVVVNGRTVHESRVEKSVRTLMAWAARDNDRTMLYGAELTITVP